MLHPTEKKKRGRPAKAPENKFVKQAFSLDPESYALLGRLAEQYGLTKARTLRLALQALEATHEGLEGAPTDDPEEILDPES